MISISTSITIVLLASLALSAFRRRKATRQAARLAAASAEFVDDLAAVKRQLRMILAYFAAQSTAQDPAGASAVAQNQRGQVWGTGEDDDDVWELRPLARDLSGCTTSTGSPPDYFSTELGRAATVDHGSGLLTPDCSLGALDVCGNSYGSTGLHDTFESSSFESSASDAFLTDQFSSDPFSDHWS